MIKWWHNEPNIIIRSYCAIAEKLGLEIQQDGTVRRGEKVVGRYEFQPPPRECDHKWRTYEGVGTVCRDCGIPESEVA